MYVDLYFIANLTLDFLLLYLLNRIIEQKTTYLRLFLGALAGALGGCIWWWIRKGEMGTLLDFFVVLFLAGVMLAISWGRRERRIWFIQLGWLFGLSVLLEGIVRLCAVWLKKGVSVIWIFGAAAAIFIAAGMGICFD